MKITQLLALGLLLAAGFSGGATTDLSFSDTTFSDTNWVPTFPMSFGLADLAGSGPVNASGKAYPQLSVTDK